MVEIFLAAGLLLIGLPQTPMGAEIEAQAATQLLSRGETHAAIERLKPAIDHYPEHLPLYLLLARAYLLEENFFWAERTVGRALEHWPDDPEVRAWLAAIHLRQGDPDLVGHDLDPKLYPERDPQRARWRLLEASRLRVMDEPDEETASRERLFAVDKLWPEDRPVWAGLMMHADPWWSPALTGTLDLGGGRTSNALAGSPTDPGFSGDPSNFLRAELRSRFIPPVHGRAKPVIDIELLGNGLLNEDYRDLSTLLTGIRLGGLIDAPTHRWDFGYRAEIVVIDQELSEFSEAHRLEVELELARGQAAFAGAGHRAYRDERRTRWEGDLGFGTPIGATRRFPVLLGATLRLADAQSPAYDQIGLSAAASSTIPLGPRTTLRVGVAAIWDDYPNSGGEEGLHVFGTEEKRRDILGRIALTLWAPGWRSLRPGFELRYTRRDSTADEAPRYDFSYREWRATIWLRWTFSADPWAPQIVTDPDHVPLEWGLEEGGAANQEDILDLLRRDEELRRGSSCSIP